MVDAESCAAANEQQSFKKKNTKKVYKTKGRKNVERHFLILTFSDNVRNF